jgi:hypothetical protein
MTGVGFASSSLLFNRNASSVTGHRIIAIVQFSTLDLDCFHTPITSVARRWPLGMVMAAVVLFFLAFCPPRWPTVLTLSSMRIACQIKGVLTQVVLLCTKILPRIFVIEEDSIGKVKVPG